MGLGSKAMVSKNYQVGQKACIRGEVVATSPAYWNRDTKKTVLLSKSLPVGSECLNFIPTPNLQGSLSIKSD